MRHVRQLDAVETRFLENLTAGAPLLQVRADERLLVELDDTINWVHGYHLGAPCTAMPASVGTSVTVRMDPVVRATITAIPQTRGR